MNEAAEVGKSFKGGRSHDGVIDGTFMEFKTLGTKHNPEAARRSITQACKDISIFRSTKRPIKWAFFTKNGLRSDVSSDLLAILEGGGIQVAFHPFGK